MQSGEHSSGITWIPLGMIDWQGIKQIEEECEYIVLETVVLQRHSTPRISAADLQIINQLPSTCRVAQTPHLIPFPLFDKTRLEAKRPVLVK